jgi:hypothetical protein
MIRIFVGCSANGEDAEAQAMLEYTLRKHHPQDDVALEWMMQTRDKASPWYTNPQAHEGWNTQGWATPFSAFRWAIPYACNYQGRAIYMDVDMIYMDDVAKLWEQQIPEGKCMLTKNDSQSCVILWDCERAKSFLPSFDDLRKTQGLYRSVRKSIGGAVSHFSGNWNCLDGERHRYKTLDDPDIKILHFTRVETQPHLKWALPRLKAKGKAHWNRQSAGLPHALKDVQPLVDKLWEEAKAAGYTAERYEAIATNFGQYDAVRGGARAA